MSLLGQVDTETRRAFPGKYDVWYPLGRPRIKDMASGDATLKGFNGAFTDGQYGYFVPTQNSGGAHGKITRLDLRDFTTVASVDLTTINASYKWYLEGCGDGRYGYCAPFGGGGTPHGYLVRFDMANFTTGGVTVLNLATVNVTYISFNGCFLDSRYLYLVPFTSTSNTSIVRVDLNNFSLGGVTGCSITGVPGGPYYGFKGGCTDGRYGYIVGSYPTFTTGKVVRFDTTNFVPAALSYVDISSVDSDFGNGSRAFTDFRYVYIIPDRKPDNVTYQGKLARIDINNFTNSGVTILNLEAVDSELKGFNNGFTDGRYGYLTPGTYGKVARIDLTNFTTSGVEVLDLRTYDSDIVVCRGGFVDKTYAYFVGFTTAVGGTTYLGKVARILATGFRSALG